MQPQIRHYQDDADMKTTTLRRCPNILILIEGQCVQLWNWRKGGWRKANKLNHIRPLGNPAHISGLSCSLSFCLLYTFFIFSLCKLQSSIYYFRIFNRVLFSYFVCILCTRSRSHWCASLLHVKLLYSSWSLWSKNTNYMLFHHFFPKIPSSLPNFFLSLCLLRVVLVQVCGSLCAYKPDSPSSAQDHH